MTFAARSLRASRSLAFGSEVTEAVLNHVSGSRAGIAGESTNATAGPTKSVRRWTPGARMSLRSSRGAEPQENVAALGARPVARQQTEAASMKKPVGGESDGRAGSAEEPNDEFRKLEQRYHNASIEERDRLWPSSFGLCKEVSWPHEGDWQALRNGVSLKATFAGP